MGILVRGIQDLTQHIQKVILEPVVHILFRLQVGPQAQDLCLKAMLCKLMQIVKLHLQLFGVKR
jgi:hypothetical protein